MKLDIKAAGWKEFQQNIDNINANLIRPQSGISNALNKGTEQVIVKLARNNVRKKFNTSGDFPKRIKSKIINQFRVDVVVDAIYAAVQEYGGTFTVTPKQRKFFWAMYYKDKKDMWKALALSETYTIPPRPYLRPAIDAGKAGTYAIASDEIYNIMKRAV